MALSLKDEIERGIQRKRERERDDFKSVKETITYTYPCK